MYNNIYIFLLCNILVKAYIAFPQNVNIPGTKLNCLRILSHLKNLKIYIPLSILTMWE